MFGKVKEYFSFNARHWALTAVVVVAVVVFAAAPIGRLYDSLKAKANFLPDRSV